MAVDNPNNWGHGMDQVLVDAMVRISLLGIFFMLTSFVKLCCMFIFNLLLG